VKHWLSLVNAPEVDQYLDIARFAEQVGFHGVSLADHLIMPLDIESKYPYTPDGKMWWPDDTPWPDPWITLTAMSAVTRTLEFATNIYLAALRDPFTAAKAVSTAAVISGDRMVCGVSAGWIREEYELMGLDFGQRGKRLDEMIVLMRKLWTGEPVEHDGEFFQVRKAILSPTPRKPIRVWSGGASKAAFRRAAENDGWLGVPMVKDQVFETERLLRSLREKLGRADLPFDFCLSLIGGLDEQLVAELAEVGITNNMSMPWMISPWGRTPWLKDDEDPADLDVKKRVMERYASSVGLIG
jgi:probable F420-dependent oxidoreductase